MAYTTSKTLLEKINANDEVSWEEFYSTYSPLIRMRGCDMRLSASERGDLVQDVMVAVFKSCRTFKYSPERGRFRNYLKKITTNCAFKIIKRRMADSKPDAGNEICMDETELDVLWREEWQAYLVSEAMEVLKDRMELLSWQAFLMYAIKNKPPEETAKTLGISVNAVYIAKSRGIAIMRDTLKTLGK